jgi:branched-chain amino acid transport system permease protein
MGAVVPILIYVVLALGLNIVVGYAGLLDLGYAAFFAIGAYVCAVLTSPRSPLFNNGQWTTNFWISMIFAFFAAILAGVVLGAPTLRLRGDYLAIVTLGFGEIVPVAFRNAVDLTNGERGLAPIARPEIFGYGIGAQTVAFDIGGTRLDLGPGTIWYYLVLALMAASIFGVRRLYDSRLGRAWIAMREDEIAAASMGINLVQTKLLAFGLGASLSGAAGAILASYVQFVAPSMFEFSTSVIVLCMVILGGLGNIWGVIVGGLLIQGFDRIVSADIDDWLARLAEATGISFLNNIGQFLANSRYLVFGLTLVIMMQVRPEGMFPSGRRRMELHPEAVEQVKAAGDGVESGPGYAPRDGYIDQTPQTAQERESLYEVRERDESIQENR